MKRQKENDYLDVLDLILFLEDLYPEPLDNRILEDCLDKSANDISSLLRRWVGFSPPFLESNNTDYHRLICNPHDVDIQLPKKYNGRDISITFLPRFTNKEQNKTYDITYGFHPSPFGEILICLVKEGICWLSFCKKNDARLPMNLINAWPDGNFILSNECTGRVASNIFTQPCTFKSSVIKIVLRPTDFQKTVLQQLTAIPFGSTVSYSWVARQIKKPSSARAVGTSIGSNPIGYLIPCHRVIPKSGYSGGFKWGTNRKKVILFWERVILNSQH